MVEIELLSPPLRAAILPNGLLRFGHPRKRRGLKTELSTRPVSCSSFVFFIVATGIGPKTNFGRFFSSGPNPPGHAGREGAVKSHSFLSFLLFSPNQPTVSTDIICISFESSFDAWATRREGKVSRLPSLLRHRSRLRRRRGGGAAQCLSHLLRG